MQLNSLYNAQSSKKTKKIDSRLFLVKATFLRKVLFFEKKLFFNKNEIIGLVLFTIYLSVAPLLQKPRTAKLQNCLFFVMY